MKTRTISKMLFGILLPFILLALFAGTACSGEIVRVDAKVPGFLAAHSFNDLEYGFTEVVPPIMIRQDYRGMETPEGYVMELFGTELSAWQTLPIPPGLRYKLNWNFAWEGRITGGRGRVGFIFGEPKSSNLLSVELTYFGTLRLLRWGKDMSASLGTIVYSAGTDAKAGGKLRLEVDYDIKGQKMLCRVNGGRPLEIQLTKYMTGAPITIHCAGFFSAVPEARRRPYNTNRMNYDIDLSRYYTRTLHEFFSYGAQ